MAGFYKNEDAVSFNVGGVSQAYNGYHADDAVKNMVPWSQEESVDFKVGALEYDDVYGEDGGDYSQSLDEQGNDSTDEVDNGYPSYGSSDFYSASDSEGVSNDWEGEDTGGDNGWGNGWGWNNNNEEDDDYSHSFLGNVDKIFWNAVIPDNQANQLANYLRFTTGGPLGEILSGNASIQFNSQAQSIYPVHVANDTNIFVGSISSDTVIGRASGFDNYMVILSHGNDIFYGGRLMENISGGHDDDFVSTGGGHDEVSMGPGYDVVFALAGDDVGGGDQVDTIVYASPSDAFGADFHELDKVYPGVTSDITVDLGHAQNGSAEIDGRTSTVISFENVISGPGDDTLIGDDLLDYGGNTLVGMAGDDTISGGWGDDVLWGGPGDDTLIGGEGSDVFFYGPEDLAGGHDVIMDYNPWEDVIDVSALGTGAGFTVEYSGGSTHLSFGDADYLIELSGYYSSDDITVHA